MRAGGILVAHRVCHDFNHDSLCIIVWGASQVAHATDDTCLFKDAHDLSYSGQGKCAKHKVTCGIEAPTTFFSVAPCKQLNLMLGYNQRSKSITDLAKEFGEAAANTKAMLDLLADLQPPLVVIQIEKFSNASAKASLTALTKELKGMGFAVGNTEACPSDLGVPLINHAGYVYCISIQRWQITMSDATQILSTAAKKLDKLCYSGKLVDLASYLVNEEFLESELTQIQSATASFYRRADSFDHQMISALGHIGSSPDSVVQASEIN